MSIVHRRSTTYWEVLPSTGPCNVGSLLFWTLPTHVSQDQVHAEVFLPTNDEVHIDLRHGLVLHVELLRKGKSKKGKLVCFGLVSVITLTRGNILRVDGLLLPCNSLTVLSPGPSWPRDFVPPSSFHREDCVPVVRCQRGRLREISLSSSSRPSLVSLVGSHTFWVS